MTKEEAIARLSEGRPFRHDELLDVRNAAGLSVEGLATIMGMSRQTISKFEHDHQRMCSKTEKLFRFAVYTHLRGCDDLRAISRIG